MSTTALADSPDIVRSRDSHVRNYPRFLLRLLDVATDGGVWFYTWMFVLTAIFLVGANAWAVQVSDGMIVTYMTDHVSWGLYIANFMFAEGAATAGVMMVIPAFLYRNKKMHDVVIVGGLLAIAAIVACLLFVTADLGRPDRFWHLIPGLGRFNFPVSMLTWDVLILNGYLLLNLHICGYLMYTRYLGRRPDPRWYVPFVMISVFWGISIHTVGAFLYCGLGGRPFWNSALLAPRFMASAFVSGPACIIVTLLFLRRRLGDRVSDEPIHILVNIIRVAIVVNLVMIVSELFTDFYTGGSHTASARYLYFGLHGHNGLVPWIWAAMLGNVAAAGMFLSPLVRRRNDALIVACVLAFAALWIEKGMGLIVPGFVPSTLHEIVEYQPSLVEWKATAGVWALGLMIYTVGLKAAIQVFTEGPPLPPEGTADDG